MGNSNLEKQFSKKVPTTSHFSKVQPVFYVSAHQISFLIPHTISIFAETYDLAIFHQKRSHFRHHTILAAGLLFSNLLECNFRSVLLVSTAAYEIRLRQAIVKSEWAIRPI